MVRTKGRKGDLISEGSELCRDGEGWCHGAQDDGSRNPKECKGPGAFRGRLVADRVPWIDGDALGTTDGGDGVRVDEQQGQLVARNRALGIGKVEGEGMASRTDRFIDSKFSARVTQKMGLQ